MESQNIEWKEVWRDDYLKWICGFANAKGGRIYIGINDNGTVIGVNNSKKLLEDIPNKIQTTMGIVADVNLLSKGEREYIEIIVKASSYPVNYKGEYHYRSGSTKQQLKGAALTEFLVSKTNFKWDAIPVDNIKITELDNESFEIFRREVLRSGRMSESNINMSNAELLDKLNLTVEGKLKRAAIMLFYNNPEKLISGSFVKIGRFGVGADLQYQDEIHGSLFNIADKVIDLIYLKYLKATISYNKDIRIETYPFPREAVREAVFNALVHCNWADSTPIQIRIENEAMYITNSCILPSEWTVDNLMKRHKSKPYNPDIAIAFFRAGYIEAWGRGIQKICEACKQHGISEPKYELLGGDLTVKFTALKTFKNPKHQNRKLDEVLEQEIISILRINNKATQHEIANKLNTSVKLIQQVMRGLMIDKKIKRINGKRFGYWIIKENIDSKNPKHQEVILDEVLKDNLFTNLKINNRVTQIELAKILNISISKLQRIMKYLIEQKELERVGGKRFGHWVILSEYKN